MSSKDVDGQFQFLIACIKHSTAGKVDFGEVAKQCDIVSKGAAAKRYERLMKAHGITSSPSGGSGGSPRTPVKKEKGATPKSSATKGTAAKKRKLEEVDDNVGDIDEPVIKVKTECRNGGIAAVAPAFASPADPGTPQRFSQDDDDDVLVVSSSEKPGSRVPVYGGDHHHHHHSVTSAQAVPATHTFDYPTNVTFHHQMTPMRTTPAEMMPAMSRPPSGTPLPYGFPGSSPFMHNHDTSAFFWQTPIGMAPSPSGNDKDRHWGKGL
ncbi:hypothetical protein JX265_003154 [Neoarthrinium moseri]|uniref:Myb-like DNA-binding domain-containing protein n=1 Tax=Neoarthrinium moseri TaxID=1658444 RepID=A0A9P9WTR3_9PEZI|nr:hypothetical protein JX265_003154 [Neoarthrinium moseri]